MLCTIDISILILTHKRPELFKRCLQSVLDNLPENLNVEILVNNDSNDIEKIESDVVKYYNFNGPVNNIYPFLFNESKGEYIMYVEDDDCLLSDIENIFKQLYDFDLHIGLFKAYKKERNVIMFQEMVKNISLKTCEYEFFQLSQMVFRKSFLTKFPKEYHNENDEYILNNILEKKPKIHHCKKFIFTQGVDYQNLSLKELI